MYIICFRGKAFKFTCFAFDLKSYERYTPKDVNNFTINICILQIQPYLNGGKVFSDAYDCVGFMTATIWSGIGVSFLVLFGVAIAINAILEIKPPNRFESNRNKQLTFTVQE